MPLLSFCLGVCGLAAHLEDIYLVENERGRGLGSRLLAFARERAALRGARSLGLHTNENNTGAQAFYRRAGFAPQSEAVWGGGREVYWVHRIEAANA